MQISFLAGLLIGAFIGGGVIYVIFSQRVRTFELTKAEMRGAFASLSLDVMEKSTGQFLKLATESLKSHLEKGDVALEEKKKLIDSNLKSMAEVLEDLKKRSTVLSTQLGENQKGTERLRETTEALRNILSSTQTRGQWGEKMVEDILNLIGLIENVNYVKQRQVDSGEKPDYTFFLPRNKQINMDVKFPLSRYERYLSANSESEREQERKFFLDDVKGHIKEVASRGYIDPVNGTVDYVLLFIPNESIYAFLYQHDPDLVKFALEKHIVLCSPVTLYAVLSLIHQAVGNFAVEQKAGHIIALLREFDKQWGEFVTSMEKMGKKIEDARKEYEHLTSTRVRQLEKPLSKIKDIELTQDSSLLPEIDPDKSG